jgi:hypothetical protein
VAPDQQGSRQTVLQALTAWQEGAVAGGNRAAEGFGRASRIQLANGAAAGKVTGPEVVAQKLPPELAALAPQIFGVIQAALAGHAAPPQTEPRPEASPSGPEQAAPGGAGAKWPAPPQGAAEPFPPGGDTLAAEAEARRLAAQAAQAAEVARRAAEQAAARQAEARAASRPTDRPAAGAADQAAPDEAAGAASGKEEADTLETLRFTPHQNSYEAEQIEQILVSDLQDGSKQLRWSGVPGGDGLVHIDRLVAADGREEPWVPEKAGHLLKTSNVAGVEQAHAEDGVEYANVRRFYVVFRNSGATLGEAAAAMPVKVARGVGLGALTDFRLFASDGQIKGTWKAPRGTQAVLVSRVPAAEAAYSGGKDLDGNPFGANGFVDPRPLAGVPMVYRAKIVHVEEGAELASETAQEEITAPAPKFVIEDLEAATQQGAPDGPTLLDLAWSAPPNAEAYSSRIYLLPHTPSGMAEGDAVPTESLGDFGLEDNSWLFGHQAFPDGAKMRMTGVPWPANMERVCLVPVTIAGDQAWVGKWVMPRAPVRPITGARLRERVNRQVVSFEWPAGADRVEAYISAPDVLDPRIGQRYPNASIGQADYRDLGGFEVPVHAGGAHSQWVIHLSPVMDNPVQRGEPYAITYTAPLFLRYWIDWPRWIETAPAEPRGLLKPKPAHVALWPPKPVLHVHPVTPQTRYSFVLLAKRTRLPLHADDKTADGGTQIRGTPLAEMPRVGAPAAAPAQGPTPDLRPVYVAQNGEALFELELDVGRPGELTAPHRDWYIRLFVNTQDKALLRLVVLEAAIAPGSPPAAARRRVPPPPPPQPPGTVRDA